MTTEAMMQMMMEGQSPACMAEQMAALAQSNPRLAPMVAKLQERMQQQARAAEAVTAEPVEEEPLAGEVLNPESHSADRAEKAVEDLKRVARRMFAELQTLRARNAKLAQALGACELCWGEDHTCPECRGNGLAGSFAIERQIFLSVVGPAMQQVRQRPTM